MMKSGSERESEIDKNSSNKSVSSKTHDFNVFLSIVVEKKINIMLGVLKLNEEEYGDNMNPPCLFFFYELLKFLGIWI